MRFPVSWWDAARVTRDRRDQGGWCGHWDLDGMGRGRVSAEGVRVERQQWRTLCFGSDVRGATGRRLRDEQTGGFPMCRYMHLWEPGPGTSSRRQRLPTEATIHVQRLSSAAQRSRIEGRFIEIASEGAEMKKRLNVRSERRLASAERVSRVPPVCVSTANQLAHK